MTKEQIGRALEYAQTKTYEELLSEVDVLLYAAMTKGTHIGSLMARGLSPDAWTNPHKRKMPYEK